MTWIVGRGGRILYRSDWTSAANVEGFLDRYGRARRRRPPGGALAAYVSEQMEFRDVDPEAFDARLRRNGPRASAEFRRAQKIWRQRR